MKKQTCRKIKVLQFDHVGEYNDRFLQFGQTNGIRILFIIGKYGVDKDMNRSLLEKVRSLLSNVQLDKPFCIEALECISHLMNRLLSTTIGDITPLDIWSSVATQDYSLLWVSGCPTYFSVKSDKLNL